MQYHVTWTIDIEASSAEEAAREALRIQRTSPSDATLFQVRETSDPKRPMRFVDLGLGV